ncbi:unannotated protein [freshwater metagenome]|uniref:Unannotated protein n=1 Tax=freshwater metagenome TaxID=449393 RepID=A0A6J7I9G2_9ZZZZ
MIFDSMMSTVLGPNHPPTKPRLPSTPSRRGGSDSVCQKAAVAALLKIESSQALPSVRRVTFHTARSGFLADNRGGVGVGPADSLMVPPAFLTDADFA